MTVKGLRPGPLAPMSDIKARMPPSPRLSARITNKQYLIEIVTMSVQTISDSVPSAPARVKWPSIACTTVCRVYNGLVPRSPNTTPSAASIAHRKGRPRGSGRPRARPGRSLGSGVHAFHLTGSALQRQLGH